MDILDLLLGSGGSIVVNKKLARTIGLDQAIVYSELASKFKYWSNQGRLVDENLKSTPEARFFFCTVDDLEESTTFKKDKQSRAIKCLEKLKLITTKKMGLPAKRYISLTNEILNYIDFKLSQNATTDNTNGSELQKEEKPHTFQSSQNASTGESDLRSLVVAKTATNNTNINNPIINNPKKENQSINTEVKKQKPIENEFIANIDQKLLDYLETKIDRLTDSEILDVISVYEDYKVMVPIGIFIAKLGDVLKATQILKVESLNAYLRKSIKNHINSTPAPAMASPAVKKDKLPKWLEAEKKAEQEAMRKQEEHQETKPTEEMTFAEMLELRKRQKGSL